MPKTKRPARVAPATPAFVPPYPPSWIDRLKGWVDRLPVPWWLPYLVLGVASVVAFTFVQARAGAYTDGFVAWHVFLALQPVYSLAAVHYLARVAADALEEFKPAVHEAGHLPHARYRLTVLPAVPALVTSLACITLMVVWILQGPAGSADLRIASSTFPLFAAFAIVMGAAYGPFVYFAIHEIREIRGLHSRAARVDLYHPDPLYAFSPLTARMAMAIILISYGWTVGDPTTFTDPLSLVTTVVMVGLALVVFLLPLWGVHGRLTAEKRRALAENGARLKATSFELHRRLDSGKIVGMDELNKALSSLDLERSHLSRVPTWPWQPETLRGLVAAVALPIVIWLIQYGLQRLLG